MNVRGGGEGEGGLGYNNHKINKPKLGSGPPRSLQKSVGNAATAHRPKLSINQFVFFNLRFFCNNLCSAFLTLTNYEELFNISRYHGLHIIRQYLIFKWLTTNKQ